ncbi:MAG: sigma-70 family RNA polymerase sigma factor [Firmicutes bacterium]|nr:sigma-70 family RNA polymerase sigma factor [Bacillota bacterium]
MNKRIQDLTFPEQNSCSDEELIGYIRQEEADSASYTKALSLLMDRYKDRVRLHARAYYLVGGDPEDLVQEGMIGLYKAIIGFQPGKGSFSSFASLCIERQIQSAVRMSRRDKQSFLNQAKSYFELITDEEGGQSQLLETIPDPDTLSPEQMVVSQFQSRAILERTRQELSPLEKKVLDLYLKGISYREIASTLEIPPKSADNAIQRIRRKITKVLTLEDFK